MAQFDVYANPSQQSRKLYPYLVDIQQPLLESLATRIVIPLANAESFQQQAINNLTPAIQLNDQTLLLMVPQLAAMPSKSLKNPIGTLAHYRHEIIAALDFAVTGI